MTEYLDLSQALFNWPIHGIMVSCFVQIVIIIIQVTVEDALLHDAMLLWAIAVNQTPIQQNKPLSEAWNGKAVADQIPRIRFNGKSNVQQHAGCCSLSSALRSLDCLSISVILF